MSCYDLWMVFVAIVAFSKIDFHKNRSFVATGDVKL